MLRAIVLSLALLIGIGTLIPLATEFAEAGSQKRRKYKKTKVKKYSKRWWRIRAIQKRARNARLRRQRQARVRRARAARLRRARLARVRRARTVRVRGAKRSAVRTAAVAKEKRKYSKARSKATRRANKGLAANSKRSAATVQPFEAAQVPAVLPTGKPAPKTWKPEGIVQGELKFRVNDNSGTPVGAAAISVIGPASLDAAGYGNPSKSVGGIATTALRRTVIDQMIRENGWVVNDYQKQIGGQNVYVVVAQAPGANNQVENRMFYFTEVEGKIYSVATKASDQASERLEEESENVINSLRSRTNPKVEIAVNRTPSNLVANEE